MLEHIQVQTKKAQLDDPKARPDSFAFLDSFKSALLDSFGFFRDLALWPFASLSAPGLFRVESLYEDTDFAQQVWCYVPGGAM